MSLSGCHNHYTTAPQIPQDTISRYGECTIFGDGDCITASCAGRFFRADGNDLCYHSLWMLMCRRRAAHGNEILQGY